MVSVWMGDHFSISSLTDCIGVAFMCSNLFGSKKKMDIPLYQDHRDEGCSNSSWIQLSAIFKVWLQKVCRPGVIPIQQWG